MVSLKNLLSTALLASTAFALPPPLRRQTGNETVTQSKRGAAYNDINAVHDLDVNGAISWAYNWAATPGGTLPDGVEFVPMLWGTKSISDFVANIETVLFGSNSKYIMGFNEPDLANQAAMSVSDAVSTFKQFIAPHAGRATLVSPGVTNSGDADKGLSWLRQFLSSCSDCGIGVLAVHWYGTEARDFTNFVQQAIDLANQQGLKEVWVTEFALTTDISTGGLTSASADFLRQVRPWLDRQSMVTRYAYFWAEEGFLVQGGQPSQAGWAYIG
ncbi:glycoside hydrolase family 128 protein [Aspergillus chevalieri]|uniref:Asl1-like glycosyl hydrolase catalytic domain-containing protein n=1 Tax=Aspergillus chevalieri TaxID=182096 RepID=A0A7R7ZTR4_ASPCH|nr:uncharacterized protein ACHE_80647S [Aspergillus chevalieri]BCR92747.1 hypothetical protein ACHE_80647S [Aspergillus chevalieri]